MSATDFQVSLARLKRSPGANRVFSVGGSYDQPVRTGLIVVPGDRLVAVSGSIEAVGDGVLVTATATTTLDAQCSRCLAEFSYPVSVDIQELFIYPDHQAQYADEEVSLIDNDVVDLADVIRDAIILDQPLIPLCRPDCRGLCPTCGADLNADPDHSHDDAVDSRWLGLTQWGKMSELPSARQMGED